MQTSRKKETPFNYSVGKLLIGTTGESNVDIGNFLHKLEKKKSFRYMQIYSVRVGDSTCAYATEVHNIFLTRPVSKAWLVNPHIYTSVIF